jgi:hypothetical protein
LDTEAEKYLRKLHGDGAKNWIVIGYVLSKLEKYSRSSAAGRPWQEVVRARLADAGFTVSGGHMYKIRRAYKFLEEQNVDALHLKAVPKISSIEIAERLFRIDEEAGRSALSDALAEVPTPYVDLKKRYENFLKAKPEMKSPRQLAWEARRSSSKASEKATETVKQGQESEDIEQKVGGRSVPNIPEEILEAAQCHAQEMWRAGWEAAESHFKPEIEGLRRLLSLQLEEKSLLEQELKDHQAEIQVLARKIKDLRGYPEDFDD